MIYRPSPVAALPVCVRLAEHFISHRSTVVLHFITGVLLSNGLNVSWWELCGEMDPYQFERERTINTT